MMSIDKRAFAYCNHCDVSVDLIKTDLKTFQQSSVAADGYLSEILGEGVVSEVVNPKNIIMTECAIMKSIELIQEMMIQIQQQGKTPSINQQESQTYIIDEKRCAVDLLLDGNIWYSIITGNGWKRNEPEVVKEEKAFSFLELIKPLFGFGEKSD